MRNNYVADNKLAHGKRIITHSIIHPADVMRQHTDKSFQKGNKRTFLS
ncbi:hypothetical protein KsCSTR_49170 [Candidatus Kuenenia stuttgartiensis]|uniref:Uncharacterized protein n=1 Tax=Kuenenia stuttgartiensis TaxID=174633 RepID=A0A6G7GY60_KUEST|nr:hypothetical protein KsCSTR_49170 [Candidatus Kuenenia stuttgartiensis]